MSASDPTPSLAIRGDAIPPESQQTQMISKKLDFHVSQVNASAPLPPSDVRAVSPLSVGRRGYAML